jgi:hypothetical protein
MLAHTCTVSWHPIRREGACSGAADADHAVAGDRCEVLRVDRQRLLRQRLPMRRFLGPRIARSCRAASVSCRLQRPRGASRAIDGAGLKTARSPVGAALGLEDAGRRPGGSPCAAPARMASTSLQRPGKPRLLQRLDDTTLNVILVVMLDARYIHSRSGAVPPSPSGWSMSFLGCSLPDR